MLTGKLVRVRYYRDRILPQYLDLGDPEWPALAERLLQLFRGQEGCTRGELDDELAEAFGALPGQLVHQGLAKLLEDRCSFEIVSGLPPEELRELVFAAAAAARKAGTFDRAAVLGGIARTASLTAAAVDSGLFADLKSEQRLVRFDDISAERLLQRYNVALAQAVLLRSTRVQVTVRGEKPVRYRQLCRSIKFHRLVSEIQALPGDGGYRFVLDGPLSLFSATQKYGLQLALFLPAVLRCKRFELQAELLWGPERKPKQFALDPESALVSDGADPGIYVPPELTMFVELFQKKISDWEIVEEAGIHPLGASFWIPDFRLTERATGRAVLLEVLGFWRRSTIEKHLGRLRQHVREPFLLAVSDQLHVEEAALEGLPAGIHRFRQMPLPDEIVRLATALLAAGGQFA